MGNNTSRTNGSRHQKDNNDAIIISNNNNSTKTSQANGIHTTTGTGTATRSHNSTTKRDNNDDDSDNEDCQFPCFLFFTPRKIPFLQQNHPHSQNNKHDFGSPLPDTPVMERRRRQEITQQATTVFQREQQQKYTNTQQQQQPQGNHHPYTGLETEEESSRSFRLSNFLIPPPASSSHHNRSNSAVAAINHVNGTHSLLLPQNRQQQQSTQQQQQPPMAPPYPEAEIYEGDDCEERLYEKYELCEVLGVGSTSTVHRCIHKVTGNEYACKIIDIQNMDVQYHSMMIQFHTEIASLKSIHHPGIIQLYDVYILSTMKIFIIMELMLGGELFDYVVEKGTLSEEEASQIVRTVLSAIHYLHTHSIIHRDLKPENLLLKYKPNNTTGNTTSQNNNNNNNSNSNKSSQKHNHGPVPVDVKIIDFGLSKLLTTDDTVASTFLGTRGYLAPEMLQRREYTSAVDTWAMGVIVYVLLCGCLPFDDDATMILPNDDQVLQKRFVLRFPRWAKNLSQSAKDLLNHLLDINPLTRYTAEQALYHPWVRGETAPSKNLLASPGRIRKSPAINNKSQNQRNGNGGGGGNTKNYLGRKYAPDPCSLTPPTPRVRKGSF